MKSHTTVLHLSIPATFIKKNHCGLLNTTSHDHELCLPASFYINFTCQKLAMKVANGNHVTVGHCDHCKCFVAKCPNHDHMTMNIMSSLWGCCNGCKSLIYFYSAIVTLNSRRERQSINEDYIYFSFLINFFYVNTQVFT